MTRVRNNAFRENRETVIEEQELGKALDNANAINSEYFRLRALAFLSLLRLSGKRRTEIAWILLENLGRKQPVDRYLHARKEEEKT